MGRKSDLENNIMSEIKMTSRNKKQKELMRDFYDPNYRVYFALGPSGSGKTYMTVLRAMQLYTERKVNKIVISRPNVGADENLGFLPGPQPLDAAILTPQGWTTMGDLEVGDYVISQDGTPTKVIGIYPKGTKSVYKVTTTDGTSTECCEDHLWFTKTAEDRKRGLDGSVKSTKKIIATLEHKPSGKKINSFKPRYGDIRPNHFIPRNEPVQYEQRELNISPYVLGAILGDGSIGGSIVLSNIDQDIIDRVAEEIKPMDMELTHNDNYINYTFVGNYSNNKSAKVVKLVNVVTQEEKQFESVGVASSELGINSTTLNSRYVSTVIDDWQHDFTPCPYRWRNQMKNELFNLGLEGTKADTKFIPDDYKYTSIEDRLALLQGLLDAAGTIKASNGEIGFCTISKLLADGVTEVVRSLGGRVRRKEPRLRNPRIFNGREIKSNHPIYELGISLPNGMMPFHCKRKADRVKDMNYIHGVGIISIEYVGEKEVQCIRINHPDHLYLTDDFIVTHNTLEQKMFPWVRPILDVMYEHWMPDSVEAMIDQDQIEIAPLSYLRGRSFPRCAIVLDEFQNSTISQMKMALTRIGEESYMFITGDAHQSDLKGQKNGLVDFCERLEIQRSSMISVTKFGKEHIERDPVVQEVLDIYDATATEGEIEENKMVDNTSPSIDLDEEDIMLR